MSVSKRSRSLTESPVRKTQLLLLGGNIIQLGLGLLITIMLARYLESEYFALFALVSSVFIVARELNEMGTGNVAITEIVRNPDNEIQVIAALLTWRRFVSIGLAGLCSLLIFTAESLEVAIVLAVASVVMSTVYLNAFMVVLQIRQAYAASIILTVSSQLLLVGLSMTLILTNMTGVVAAWFLLIRECIQTFGTRLLALKWLTKIPRPGWRLEQHHLFQRTIVFGLANVFYHLSIHGGTFFVWFLEDSQGVAAYSAVFRLFYPLLTLPWVLMIPLLPVLAELYHKQSESFGSQIGINFRTFFGIGLSIAVAGYTLAPEILSLLYGSKFLAGPDNAVVTFRFLSLANFLGSIIPALAIGLLASGKERRLSSIAGGALVANVFCSVFFISKMGFAGAALALTISEMLLITGLIYVTVGIVGWRSLIEGSLQFTLPAIFLFFALSMLPESPRFRLPWGLFLTFLSLVIVWTLSATQGRRKV